MKQCVKLLSLVFGYQEKELITKFSNYVKDYIEKNENTDKKISAYSFLFLLVSEYHKNKLTFEKIDKKSSQNLEISFQKNIDNYNMSSKETFCTERTKQSSDCDYELNKYDLNILRKNSLPDKPIKKKLDVIKKSIFINKFVIIILIYF